MSKKKITVKDQLEKANRTLYLVLDQYHVDDVMKFLISERETIIDHIDEYIEEELEYIKHETDSYAGQKVEAKKVVKHYGKQKKQQQLILQKMNQLAKLMSKGTEDY